ncbi:MAG: FAD-binding oxidoreductase [Pyrinomonadaceae bacterium]
MLATNDGGALRLRFGSLRDFVTGVTLALADGTIARSGGRVVKNVAGYDLPKLMIGALGTLGVILEATFRLPMPVETETVCFAAQSNDAAHAFMLAVQDSSLVAIGLQLFAEHNAPPAIAVRFEGHRAGIEAQVLRLMEKSRSASVWRIAASNEVWHSRERLWDEAEQALLMKISVEPTQLAPLCSLVDRFASAQRIHWKLVAQAFGICTLRLGVAGAAQAVAAVDKLRAETKALGGTLVVLRCSPEAKHGIDVWGATGDALPLMRRVKEQFDASGTLNPHRFVGGM